MKTQFLIPICCSLIFIGCSESDDNSYNQDSSVTSYAYIEFLKNDDSSFSEGEIEVMTASINHEGDTIYSDWKPFQVLGEIHSEFSDADLLFGPLIVADYDGLVLNQGDSWNRNMMYWFRYEGLDQIDFLKINDSGAYQEFREIKFYLNNNVLMPDHEHGIVEFFFILSKEGF